jgi:hypothetical protein
MIRTTKKHRNDVRWNLLKASTDVIHWNPPVESTEMRGRSDVTAMEQSREDDDDVDDE